MFDGHEKDEGYKNVVPSFFHGLGLGCRKKTILRRKDFSTKMHMIRMI
jgi:hypothetical protein